MKENPAKKSQKSYNLRAVGRSENPGVHKWPSLVEIGLTDLPKSEGSPPCPPGSCIPGSVVLVVAICNCNPPILPAVFVSYDTMG